MINYFKIQDTTLSVSTEKTDTLTIESHPKSYDVHFEKFNNNFTEDQVVLVDANVQKLYNINHSKMIVIDAMETNKSIDTVLRVCEDLLAYGFDKGHTLIVIGGGIVQDIGAFTAKVYKRGINWVFVPTTLLSQCDSCIGGKTALNHLNYKNQLALFSAPNKVIIDTEFLNTLQPQDITSGYGEIVKLFLTGGSWYVDQFDEFTREEAIFHALSIKKAVVECDEFEDNERKSLNYGHSFGHVIESMTDYAIPHGTAVMLGIDIINKIYSSSDEVTRLVNKFTSIDLIKDIDVNKLVTKLKTDKKVSNGVISLVVVLTPGVTVFVNQTIDETLKNIVHAVFTN
jgi:3-dehydroquinate synthase